MLPCTKPHRANIIPISCGLYATELSTSVAGTALQRTNTVMPCLVFFNCFPYKHSFFNMDIITLGLHTISKLQTKQTSPFVYKPSAVFSLVLLVYFPGFRGTAAGRSRRGVPTSRAQLCRELSPRPAFATMQRCRIFDYFMLKAV